MTIFRIIKSWFVPIKWKAVAVHHDNVFKIVNSSPHTTVLYISEYGDARTEHHSGKWELSHFIQKDEQK